MSYGNPYSDLSFFGFFFQLLSRIAGFASGELGFSDLASDEVQLLVLLGVSSSCASLGCFLLLRRMTMLANALSHTILIGIVFVYLFSKGLFEHGTIQLPLQPMMAAAVAMGLLTAFLTQFFTRIVGLQEDASIGLVFTSLFALGIVSVTLLTRNAHIGAEVVMGNVDALHAGDCRLAWTVFLLNLLLIALFFKQYHITSFDPAFAKALGFSLFFYDYLLMIQTSLTTIGAFRAVGLLMVLAFIVTPPLAARLFSSRLKGMLLLSNAIGWSASLIGVALSRHLLAKRGIALSTGGLVVCILVVEYLLMLAAALLRKRGRRKSAPLEGFTARLS